MELITIALVISSKNFSALRSSIGQCLSALLNGRVVVGRSGRHTDECNVVLSSPSRFPSTSIDKTSPIRDA